MASKMNAKHTDRKAIKQASKQYYAQNLFRDTGQCTGLQTLGSRFMNKVHLNYLHLVVLKVTTRLCACALTCVMTLIMSVILF